MKFMLVFYLLPVAAPVLAADLSLSPFFTGNLLAGGSRSMVNLAYNPAKFAAIKTDEENRVSQVFWNSYAAAQNTLSLDFEALQKKKPDAFVDSFNLFGGVGLTSLFHSNFHLALGFGSTETVFNQRLALSNSGLNLPADLSATTFTGMGSLKLQQDPKLELDLAIAYSLDSENHIGLGFKVKQVKRSISNHIEINLVTGNTLVIGQVSQEEEYSESMALSLGYKQNSKNGDFFIGIIPVSFSWYDQKYAIAQTGILPPFDFKRETHSTILDPPTLIMGTAQTLTANLKLFSEVALLFPFENQYDDFFLYLDDPSNVAYYTKFHVTETPKLGMRFGVGFSYQIGKTFNLQAGLTLFSKNSDITQRENNAEAVALNGQGQKIESVILQNLHSFIWQAQLGVNYHIADNFQLVLGCAFNKLFEKKGSKQFIAIDDITDVKVDVIKVMQLQFLLGVDYVY